MSNVEIDLSDANALAGMAVGMFSGQTHQEHRAAALLVAAAWLLMHDDGQALTQEAIDRAVRQCVRNGLCPCKVSVAGGPMHEMADLAPAWAVAMEADGGRS